MHHFPRRMETRVRHLDRGAAPNPANMIVRAAPIRHDHAVVAPLFPENLEHKLRIFIRLEPVHLVVTRHQRAGLSLFDRNLKAGQVNLPERPLVDLGVQYHAPEFLRIYGVVLHAGECAAALDTAHIGRRELAGKIGILRKVLKIPPAERTPLDVEPGAEQHIHALRTRLASERFADLLRERCIPAVGDSRRRRETGRGKRGVQSEVVANPLLFPEPVRPVGKEKSRQSPSGECPALPCAAAGQQRCLFEQTQLPDTPFRHLCLFFFHLSTVSCLRAA